MGLGFNQIPNLYRLLAKESSLSLQVGVDRVRRASRLRLAARLPPGSDPYPPPITSR